MLVRQFPNLTWLKRQIQQGFPQALRAEDMGKGWPTVLLCAPLQEERMGVEGTFSLFMNLQGYSHLRIAGRHIPLGDNAYVVSNQGELYDLWPKKTSNNNYSPTTQTCNLHFGADFMKQAWHYLQHSSEQLLDSPTASTISAPLFAPKATKRSPILNQLIQQLQATSQQEQYSPLDSDPILFQILIQLLDECQQSKLQSQQLQALKFSTRQELLQRLHCAVDYIYAYYHQTISLDQLAQISCLSKYHFLRSFKQAFQQSPKQLIQQLRLQKSLELLQYSRASLQEIAEQVGIAYASSLSRLITQHTGQAPTTFRS